MTDYFNYFNIIVILLCTVCASTFILIFIRVLNKLSYGVCRSRAHLVGKVVIVTGANGGIGYETARDLAVRGARVLIACRSKRRGVSAQDRLRAETGNLDVHFRHLDLSSLVSVRRFAKEIADTESRLDVLINNAGAGGLGNYKTEDGLQVGMQVNHFGPFLLMHLLLPLLKTSAPSRIVTVSSMAYAYASLDLSDLNMDRGWSDFKVYTNSKLCNLLTTIELGHRLEGSGVTANCLHPGFVATALFRNIPQETVRRTVDVIFCLLFKSALEGAQTSVYLAVAWEVRNVTGRYFENCRESKLAAIARDPALARTLYQESARLVGYKLDASSST